MAEKRNKFIDSNNFDTGENTGRYKNVRGKHQIVSISKLETFFISSTRWDGFSTLNVLRGAVYKNGLLLTFEYYSREDGSRFVRQTIVFFCYRVKVEWSTSKLL